MVCYTCQIEAFIKKSSNKGKPLQVVVGIQSLGVSSRRLQQTMTFPDPEGFRMHAHKVCDNTYCIKRLVLHMISFS
jgi:hypothetical protein